jgi:hypothetical protein
MLNVKVCDLEFYQVRMFPKLCKFLIQLFLRFFFLFDLYSYGSIPAFLSFLIFVYG